MILQLLQHLQPPDRTCAAPVQRREGGTFCEASLAPRRFHGCAQVLCGEVGQRSEAGIVRSPGDATSTTCASSTSRPAHRTVFWGARGAKDLFFVVCLFRKLWSLITPAWPSRDVFDDAGWLQASRVVSLSLFTQNHRATAIHCS